MLRGVQLLGFHSLRASGETVDVTRFFNGSLSFFCGLYGVSISGLATGESTLGAVLGNSSGGGSTVSVKTSLNDQLFTCGILNTNLLHNQPLSVIPSPTPSSSPSFLLIPSSPIESYPFRLFNDEKQKERKQKRLTKTHH